MEPRNLITFFELWLVSTKTWWWIFFINRNRSISYLFCFLKLFVKSIDGTLSFLKSLERVGFEKSSKKYVKHARVFVWEIKNHTFEGKLATFRPNDVFDPVEIERDPRVHTRRIWDGATCSEARDTDDFVEAPMRRMLDLQRTTGVSGTCIFSPIVSGRTSANHARHHTFGNGGCWAIVFYSARDIVHEIEKRFLQSVAFFTSCESTQNLKNHPQHSFFPSFCRLRKFLEINIRSGRLDHRPCSLSSKNQENGVKIPSIRWIGTKKSIGKKLEWMFRVGTIFSCAPTTDPSGFWNTMILLM